MDQTTGLVFERQARWPALLGRVGHRADQNTLVNNIFILILSMYKYPRFPPPNLQCC